MERRLAAIMAADVVAYSRRMGEDEDGTLAALRQLRAEVLEPAIAEHAGRVVKRLGDGVLAEFHSAHDAVEAGVAVQRALAAADGGHPATAAGLQLRIGINVGDVIPEGDDIYGDGVNVAARLEDLAEPGGICVSESIVEYLRGQAAVRFEPMGERRLKNIPRPVAVYRVRWTGAAPPRRRTAWAIPGGRRAALTVAVAVAAAAGLAAGGLAAYLALQPEVPVQPAGERSPIMDWPWRDIPQRRAPAGSD